MVIFPFQDSDYFQVVCHWKVPLYDSLQSFSGLVFSMFSEHLFSPVYIPDNTIPDYLEGNTRVN